MNRPLARLIVLLAIIATVLPLVWLGVSSLKSRQQITASPPTLVFRPNIDNYRFEYHGNLVGSALVKSGLIATCSATLATVLGAALARWLSSLRIPWQRRVLWLLLSCRMGPAAIAMLPLFVLMTTLDGDIGGAFVVGVHTAAFMPLATWYLARSIAKVPSNLRLAALVDGASPAAAEWMGVWRPLFAAMALTWLLAFLMSWNEYPASSLFSSSATRPVSAMLPVFMNLVVQWGEFAAVAMMAIIPGLIVAVVLARSIWRRSPKWRTY